MVHVDGRPLAQTAFAKDALSPSPLAPLQQVFAAAKPGLRVKAAAPSDAFEAGTDIWIVDSEIDADLARIVETLASRMNSVLMVGSAGLTRALALVCFDGHPTSSGPQHVTGTIVFAVGSRAARSAEQVESLATEPETKVLRAPNGWLQCAEIPGARNLVLKATVDDAGGEGDSRRVAEVVEKYVIVIARCAQGLLLVTPGVETASAGVTG